jgi:rhamnosyltransferase
VKVSIVVPVHRAAAGLATLLEALRRQVPPPDEVVVVETDPEPGNRELVEGFGARHLAVSAAEYDHAGTRSLAARSCSGDIVVLLSQDVVPQGPATIARLVLPLRSADSSVAATYGRQVSEVGGDELMALKREYLYPAEEDERGLGDRPRLGFRTVQMSNAFGAYRRDVLAEIGWFGERQLVCEDVSATARLLQAGYRVRYVAAAVAVHTHGSGLLAELRRYFDIGAAYQADPNIFGTFGQPRREGWRFLAFGLRSLFVAGRPALMMRFLLESVGKRVFFSLGLSSRFLPRWLRPHFSTLPLWWR